MASFIKLTHHVDGKQTPMFVNVEQICRVAVSTIGGAGYQTNISLANGQVDVLETVPAVMQLIKAPNVA